MENQAQEPQSPAKISQTNVTWKGNGKSVFQSAFETWGRDKPRGSGAGDFILDLIQRASKAQAAIETDSRLESLGIAELVNLHRRRMEADTRMLEQIADIVADARGKAEEAVKIELEALRTGKASLESSLQTITSEFEKSRQELEELKAAFTQTAAEKAESEKQCQAQLAELEKVKGQLEKATLASEQLASQLEQAKQANIILKESALKHESELNSIQKKANEIEFASNKALAEKTAQIQSLQASQSKAEIESKAVIMDLQGKFDQLTKKAAQMQEQAQRGEKAIAELAEARIKIASLEATVKGQQESISNMSKTMEVLRNFRAVLQRQPPKLEATTVTGNIGKHGQSSQPGQQDKTK